MTYNQLTTAHLRLVNDLRNTQIRAATAGNTRIVNTAQALINRASTAYATYLQQK